MSSVVHFEMPAENMERIAEFYNKAFGWKTQMLDKGRYALATTTETDEKTARPKNPGAINGGFFPKKEDSAQHPSFVIGVDDIKEAIKKVNAAGGKILGEPTEIEGYGTYAWFIDTEGNRISMMQPSEKWLKK